MKAARSRSAGSQRHHVELDAGRPRRRRGRVPPRRPSRCRGGARPATRRRAGRPVDGFSLQRVVRPRRPILGSVSPRSIDAMPATVVRRCMSTVYRWYGSCCGRHRTAAHDAGSGRADRDGRGPRACRSPARPPGAVAGRHRGPRCPRHGVRYPAASTASSNRGGDAFGHAPPSLRPPRPKPRATHGPVEGRRGSVAAIGEQAIEHRRSDVLDVRACSTAFASTHPSPSGAADP